MFRIVLGLWFIVMQVLLIACLVRNWSVADMTKVWVAAFTKELTLCVIWPLLMFTQRGRRQLKLLFSFK